MSETREQVIVEEIRADLGALKKHDTSCYESGDSDWCNTTADGP
jgi:hypothetical protein